jgi:hypothetical protein
MEGLRLQPRDHSVSCPRTILLNGRLRIIVETSPFHFIDPSVLDQPFPSLAARDCWAGPHPGD